MNAPISTMIRYRQSVSDFREHLIGPSEARVNRSNGPVTLTTHNCSEVPFINARVDWLADEP